MKCFVVAIQSCIDTKYVFSGNCVRDVMSNKREGSDEARGDLDYCNARTAKISVVGNSGLHVLLDGIHVRLQLHMVEYPHGQSHAGTS